MERLLNEDDASRGVVTYRLGRNRYVKFTPQQIHLYGLETLLKRSGVTEEELNERLPVMQDGRVVGTLPAVFDPMQVRSRSFMYQPRPGDFTLQDGKWIACSKLGMGDFEAIPEFRRSWA